MICINIFKIVGILYADHKGALNEIVSHDVGKKLSFRNLTIYGILYYNIVNHSLLPNLAKFDQKYVYSPSVWPLYPAV